MNASAILAPTRDRYSPSVEQPLGNDRYEIRRDVRRVPGQDDRAVPAEVESDLLEILGTREIEQMEAAIR